MPGPITLDGSAVFGFITENGKMMSGPDGGGRSLEETGILPDDSYGPVLRERLGKADGLVLAGVGDSDAAAGNVVHRFQRIIAEDGALLGFVCVSEGREHPGAASRDGLPGNGLRDNLITIVRDLKHPL